ncbi:MAG: DUF5050 domain-containing protein [Deltaproteobacteria bacterium]|nr:DUF5050 domain-containing protein [Deltaproteobacteria bacterium]
MKATTKGIFKVGRFTHIPIILSLCTGWFFGCHRVEKVSAETATEESNARLTVETESGDDTMSSDAGETAHPDSETASSVPNSDSDTCDAKSCDTAQTDGGGLTCPSATPTRKLGTLPGDMDPLGMDSDYLIFHHRNSASMTLLNKQTGTVTEAQSDLFRDVNGLVMDSGVYYFYKSTPRDPGVIYPVDHALMDLDNELEERVILLDGPLVGVDVKQGQLFYQVSNRDGLRSMDVTTAEERVWTEDKISSFHITDTHVAWMTQTDNTQKELKRVPRFGGDAEVLASGPISVVEYTDHHVLLTTSGGAKGPPVYSAKVDSEYQGVLWLVPDSTIGLDFPQTVSDNSRILADAHKISIFHNYLYAVNDEGELWRFPLSDNNDAPIRLDIQGAYDEDDYAQLLLMESQTIYWLAGPTRGTRVTEDDDIAVYRTCLDTE